MFLKILISYFLGYVNLIVEGFYIERFINLCMKKEILLWGIRREKSTLMHVKIRKNDFQKIRGIAKKSNCKIKIQNKKGIPFLMHRYQKRKIFLGALLCLVLGMGILTNFIWNIEIIGVEEEKKIEILDVLSTCGLSNGMLKKQVNTSEIANKIRLERDDVAWIGIEIKGTNAIVTIAETTEKPELINHDEYCNIVAEKNGVIEKIDVQSGTAAVKAGDVVRKGDVLVYGYMEGKYTGVRYTHSLADIVAKVSYQKQKKENKKQEISTRTGEEESKFEIKLNNFQINLYKRVSKFENYDTIRTSKKFVLFSNFYLPFEWVKKTNYEVQKQEKTYETEELKQKIAEQLTQEIETEILKNNQVEKILFEEEDKPENAVKAEKKIETNETNDEVEMKMIYIVEEKIGTEEKTVY